MSTASLGEVGALGWRVSTAPPPQEIVRLSKHIFLRASREKVENFLRASREGGISSLFEGGDNSKLW